MLLHIALLLGLAGGDGAVADRRPLPEGKSKTEVLVGTTKLEVETFKPAGWKGERLIVVLHGILRNADEYRDHAIVLAERFDALIVAPRFDAERFPTHRYQRGGLLTETGQLAPRAEWSFTLIPEVARRVRELEGRPQLPYWIIGHSAGGQIALRMCGFVDTGAERVVAANPGSALFPSRDFAYGYGFGELPAELADDAAIERYLRAPLTLFLGTADDHPDEYFDASPTAALQGSGRHQRGLALFERARLLAQQRGWEFRWRLVEAVGVGHDHEKMFAHALCETALFGTEPRAAAGAAPAPAEPVRR